MIRPIQNTQNIQSLRCGYCSRKADYILRTEHTPLFEESWEGEDVFCQAHFNEYRDAILELICQMEEDREYGSEEYRESLFSERFPDLFR